MARMELPVLDKFCFVFHLRTGCIAMGFINAVLTFILAVLLGTYASEVREVGGNRRDEVEPMSSVVYTIVVLLDVLLALKLLLDLIFVYAVHKEKIGIMKNYCIFWIVFLVLFIIGFLKTLFHMDAGYVIAQILYLVSRVEALLERALSTKTTPCIWTRMCRFLTMFSFTVKSIAENFYYIVVIRSYLISINEDGVL